MTVSKSLDAIHFHVTTRSREAECASGVCDWWDCPTRPPVVAKVIQAVLGTVTRETVFVGAVGAVVGVKHPCPSPCRLLQTRSDRHSFSCQERLARTSARPPPFLLLSAFRMPNVHFPNTYCSLDYSCSFGGLRIYAVPGTSRLGTRRASCRRRSVSACRSARALATSNVFHICGTSV